MKDGDEDEEEEPLNPNSLFDVPGSTIPWFYDLY